MTDHNQLPEGPDTGHEYDGIRELDNPLPRWWLYGFYLTIIFAVFYTAYYEFGPGVGLVATYNEKVAALQADRAAKAAAGGVDLEALGKVVASHEEAEKGKALFAERCAACHGDAGQGVIGPNLTDNYWLHGGKPDKIMHTIRVGVADKGMPAWGESMSDGEIMQVVAHIVAIRGTHPEGAKEPQGDLEEAAPAAVGGGQADHHDDKGHDSKDHDKED